MGDERHTYASIKNGDKSKGENTMRVLKIVCGSWKHPSRDLRELKAAEKAGFQVSAIIKNGSEIDKNGMAHGISVAGMDTRPFGNRRILKHFNHVFSILLWSRYISKRKDEVLSCHDLPALLVGYLSNCFLKRENRKILIYDSHELEVGRAVKRGQLKKFIILQTERFLIQKAYQTIVVNDSIAGELIKIHHLKQRPVVVRNIPEYYKINDNLCTKVRKTFCQKLKCKNNDFLIMYHGMIMENRGIEKLIELLNINPYIYLIILGPGADIYIKNLKGKAQKLGVHKRVLFCEGVDQQDLWKYVGAVDLGMVLVQNFSKSYYLSLPNKLFENIQSETPVIGSNFPEISKIIQAYQIGMVCIPDDIVKINECVEKMRKDMSFYSKCKNNVKDIKEELCWEKEEKIIIKLYKSILCNLQS